MFCNLFVASQGMAGLTGRNARVDGTQKVLERERWRVGEWGSGRVLAIAVFVMFFGLSQGVQAQVADPSAAVSPSVAGLSMGQPSVVREWLVLGTFSAESGKSLDTDFIVSEQVIRPRGGLITSGRPWRHHEAPGMELDLLDLTLDLFPVESAIAYAHVYVRSPKPDTVSLVLGYDDSAALLVNGQKTWRHEQRQSTRGSDTVTVTLNEGWNGLLFKVFNGVGEWRLAAQFIDAPGLIIQAEIPDRLVMIPRADPELVRIRTIELADEAILTAENRPVLQFKTVLYNPQERSLGECTARLVSRSGAVVGAAQSFVLHAGELKPVYFAVPAASILESYQASGSWQLRLEFDKYQVRRIVPLQYDGRLLGKILGTFEVEGVEPVATNGSQTFRRVLFVPWEWAGMPLHLSVDVGEAESEVTINGEQKRFDFQGYSGDIWLTDSAEVGTRFEVLINCHLNGQSTAASTHRLAQSDGAAIVPKLTISVENVALRRYLASASLLQQYRGDAIEEQKNLDEQMFAALKARNVKRLNQIISEAYSLLPAIPEAEDKVPDVSLVGNAHVELARLSHYSDLIEEYRATFKQVLQSLDKHPGFHFSQGEAFSYWWIEQEDPQLFASIKAAVQQGRWEVVGGAWTESDLDVPSGESLARQFLYGKRYLKEKLGVDAKLAWRPNVAGHPWTLPQILKKSGMVAYLFYQPWESLRLFDWEGLDGSHIIGYRPPEQHNALLTRDEGRHSLISKQRFEWPKVVRLYGVENSGNRPNARDIRLAEDMAYVTAGRAGHPAVPSVRMANAQPFFDDLVAGKVILPVHRNEISTYQSRTWIDQPKHKWQNRRVEMLLPAAEAFSLFARPHGFEYPHTEFTAQWRNLLFNQSHELLSGAGSEALHEDVQRLHREALETAKAALDKSMNKIEAAMNTQTRNAAEIPVAVYNAFNWARTGAVEIDVTVPLPPPPAKSATASRSKKKAKVEEAQQWPYFRDSNGEHVPVQVLHRDSTSEGIHYRFLFLPKDVPAMGYKTYWLEWLQQEPEFPRRARIDLESLAMSNEHFTISLDSLSGALARMVDSQFNREWMSGRGSLSLFGLNEEAQSGTLSFGENREELRLASRPEVLENGPLRTRLRTRYVAEHSVIVQDYIMYSGVPYLEIQYQAEWNERNKLLKLVYPLYVPDAHLMAEIPFGAISRPVDGQEFPMQKWLDLSNDQFGIAVLNDGRYSADMKEGALRISALFSDDTTASENNAEEHHFTLALYPHKDQWKQAQVMHLGYEFNLPLFGRVVAQHSGSLPATHSFVTVEPGNAVISALKKSEDDGNWIMRVYESTGSPASVAIGLPFAATSVSEVSLIEWDEKPLPLSGTRFNLELGAWEVKTLKINTRGN